MGVCVPEEYGGAGADFLSYILVLEELSRADAGVGVTVAVHTSAVTLPILAFGTDEQRARFVPPLARGEADRRLRADRAGGGLGRRLAPHAADANGDGWTHLRREAVDHERPRTRARSCSSRAPTRTTPGARGVSRVHPRRRARPRRRATRRSSASTRRSTADLAIEGADVGARPAAPRGGQGLHGRDGDARRRPDRDRRAGARHRAGRVRRRARLRARAAAVRQGDRRASRRSSGSSPTCRPRSTRRGCSSTGPRG